jgi:5-methylthioadenosine/S-adenosylhomocysteine deaminase
MRNLVPNLVYGCRGNEVLLTAVDGRVLYRDGRYLTLDEGEVRGNLCCLAERIGRQAEEEFMRLRGTNAAFMEEGRL